MAEQFFEFERSPEDDYVFKFRPSMLNLFPPPTRQHMRAARKEVLLAFRSIIDRAIERVEEEDKKQSKRRTRIEVQE